MSLTNGCGFSFPARKVQGLEMAHDRDLAEVAVLGAVPRSAGERLDVDASVPGLLAGVFGTRSWLDRQRAARAGATRSPAKTAAARRTAPRAAGRGSGERPILLLCASLCCNVN